jgi:hypothetical protein
MRTLLRPGRRGLLVKIEGHGGTRFLVGDPRAEKPRVVYDLEAAVRLFENLEQQPVADADSNLSASIRKRHGFLHRRLGPAQERCAAAK